MDKTQKEVYYVCSCGAKVKDNEKSYARHKWTQKHLRYVQKELVADWNKSIG